MIASRRSVRRAVASARRAVRARRRRAADAGHRRVLPHQGAIVVEQDERESGRRGAELRPHGRPRARGGDEVPPLPARRSGRLRNAGRRRPRRRARRTCRPRSRRARRAHRADGAAAAGRRPLSEQVLEAAIAATRRWSPAGCTSSRRPRSARRRPSTDVTDGRGTARGAGLRRFRALATRPKELIWPTRPMSRGVLLEPVLLQLLRAASCS